MQLRNLIKFIGGAAIAWPLTVRAEQPTRLGKSRRVGTAAHLLGTCAKRTIISAAVILAFAAPAHADELSDIKAQAKQLREQNQAMTKRLAELEKRQQALESQSAAKPAVAAMSPVDAMAADLLYKAAVKAKAAESDYICWHGVCLYGNFDMGLNYENHGSPFSPSISPLNYVVERASNGSYFGVAANQFSTSFLGLRGKQAVGDDLYAVVNLVTMFIPASGASLNALGAVVQNNGLGQAGTLGSQVNAAGDASKAGQLFNHVAYFGISSPTYGTFTMGRQTALSSDLVFNYNALSSAIAWSLISFEGAAGGGGVTENRIYDNSYQYRLNVGQVRLAAETQIRNGGNSATGNAFDGDIGFDYMDLSMDFVGGKTYGAISVATTLSTAQVAALLPAPGVPCSLGCVSAIVSDNTVFSVGAKYTVGPWKFYGGYVHLQYARPNNPLLPGAFAFGGYNVGVVNNAAYQSDRNQHVFWAGAKYAVTPTFDIAASYYGIRQEAFLVAGLRAGTLVSAGSVHGAVSGGNCSNTTSPGCSGTADMFSAAMDWRFARHIDFYAGVAYSQKTGGLASGFVLAASNASATGTPNVKNRVSIYDPGIGLRYEF